MPPANYRYRFSRVVVLPLMAGCFAFGCASAVSKKPTEATADGRPPVDIVHEPCDTDSKNATKTDANGDGRPDIIQVMNGNREVCRAIDLNFDGLIDNYLYFDDAGNLRRRESDFDRDGLIDEIAYYQNGVIVQKHRETNLDGKLDTWDTYRQGLLTERLRDSNRDGKVDQWWTFPDPNKLECPVVAVDESGTGRPDVRYDPCKEREAEMTASEPQHPPTPAPDATPVDASTDDAIGGT